MTNDALIQKHSHLLQDFDLHSDNFLIARAVRLVDHAIRKVTRNPQPLSLPYLSAFILFFSVLPGFVTILLLGETTPFKVVGVAWILGVTVSTLGALTANYLGRYTLKYIKDYLLNIQDAGDLDDLHNYLHILWSPAHPYQRIFVPAVLWGIFASSLFSYVAGEFAGIGVVIGTLVFGFNLGIGFDYLIWIIGLPKHFEKYHYVLNNVNPASSEIVYRIANMFNKVMYVHAVYFTVATISAVSLGKANYIAIPVVLAFWTALTIQFISTQSALKNIISTAKWNTLNNIQADIRALQSSGTLMQKETTDAINRLMDLHERIRLTPDSTMNIGTSLNFINQLFLPILGATLSELEFILRFFHLR
jgi:hypothetical protein